MSEPIWDKFLTERDKAVFGALGVMGRGPGSANGRPC